MIIAMTGVVDNVVVAQIFFNEGNVDRMTFEVDVKNFALLVKKILNLYTFTIRRLQVTPWVGED